MNPSISQVNQEAATNMSPMRASSPVAQADRIDIAATPPPKNGEIIVTPNKIDVLFGRGKKFQDHFGNQRMREISEKNKATYFAIKRFEKQRLVESVFRQIKEGGTRFLKRSTEGEGWVEVQDHIAVEKVSHCLRSRRYQPPKDQRTVQIEKSGLIMPPSAAGLLSGSAYGGIPTGLNFARRLSTSAVGSNFSDMSASASAGLPLSFTRRWSEPHSQSMYPLAAQAAENPSFQLPTDRMPANNFQASPSVERLRYLTLMKEELKLKSGILQVERQMHQLKMEQARSASIRRFVSRQA